MSSASSATPSPAAGSATPPDSLPTPAPPATPCRTPRVLTEPDWRARQQQHQARVDALLTGHRDRRRRGVKHPVEDFLFTYYSFRPGRLRRWHPGYGTALAGSARAFLDRGGYVDSAYGVLVDPDLARRRLPTVRWIRDLLAATATRPAHYGCFGLHEWAMVYRADADQIRHSGWPLRLGSSGTDEVVEQHRIRCSHFDAFRFFTDAARPRNTLQPTREGQPRLEQAGCLHANMDCYKWAGKLSPLTPSELVADCFELAREIRELDMRASPYDLSELGYEPVRIETREGKAAYVAAQAEYAERAGVLRSRLVEVCDAVLTELDQPTDRGRDDGSARTNP